MKLNEPVVKVRAAAVKGKAGFFGKLSRLLADDQACPSPDGAKRLFHEEWVTAEQRSFIPHDPGAQPPAGNGRSYVVDCSVTPRIAFLFTSARDEGGHAWDLSFGGVVRVVDPGAFLRHLDRANPSLLENDLLPVLLPAAIQPVLKPQLRTWLATQSWRDLRDAGNPLAGPLERRIQEWLAGPAWATGLEVVEVDALRWRSAKGEDAEQERINRQHQAAQEARLTELRRLEQEAQAMERTFLAQKTRVEHAEAREELQRQQELAVAGKEHELKMVLLEQQIFDVRLAMQTAQAELAMKEAVLKEKLAADSPGHQQTQGFLKELAQYARWEQSHEASRLLRRMFDAQMVSEGGHGVRLVSGSEYVKIRDIGVREVNEVRINDTLRFKLESERDGFVLLLNLGTSGNVHILLPNQNEPAARIKRGQTYLVPGPELVTPPTLQPFGGSLIETGPPGYEVVAALVSDAPLLTPDWLKGTKKTGPFYTLTSRHLGEFLAILANAPEHSWSAGMIELLVKDR